GGGVCRRMWVGAALACAVAGTRAWPGGAVCARRAAGAGGARYAAFLSRGGPGPTALVERAWAGRGRLRGCWVRCDPRLVRAFRAACARRPPARRRSQPPRRRRRGWTLTGTLWCGAGDSAGNDSDLGVFRGPDRCCREHDQCSAQIMALQFNYGIRNYRLHTVFHCDCDARFRQCLLALNDTISNIIGVTFFNLLEVPCFVLEKSEECVQWHWWGGCERYGVVPLARMVQQRQYHYSLPTEGTGSPAVQPPGKGGKFSRYAPQLGCPKVSAHVGCVLGVPLTALLSSGLGRVCKSYEHLDKCKHQIVPSEVKYQLHNMDTWMLFHCNCTRRCVSRRKRQGSSHPGTMCTYCIATTRAVLVPARHLKKTLRHWGSLHVNSRAKHPDWKTQDSGGTLYEQCLRMALEQKPHAQPDTVL
uniref:phospholipase A2 n=1 Tax=Strigops habroptila TaxID=2489341 RepID=A0A672U0G5_STRHB